MRLEFGACRFGSLARRERAPAQFEKVVFLHESNGADAQFLLETSLFPFRHVRIGQSRQLQLPDGASVDANGLGRMGSIGSRSGNRILGGWRRMGRRVRGCFGWDAAWSRMPRSGIQFLTECLRIERGDREDKRGE